VYGASDSLNEALDIEKKVKSNIFKVRTEADCT
jgi:hypothetical protein